MATIVKHKKNSKKYVLLGSGFGMYKTVSPSFFGGSLLPDEEDGTRLVITVTDASGLIKYFDSSELEVLSVDGVLIHDYSDMLGSEESSEHSYDYCPACDCRLLLDDDICPSCGLRVK